jgi:ABC-type branched-subunit amino acid transport system substrate-binding protein
VALPLVGASAALVLGLVLLRSGSDDEPCSGISTTEDTRERVGVGDGTTACTFFPEQAGLEGLDKELNDKHQAVERRIADANEAVIASAGGRYQTIVFFAPLGTPTGSERAGQSGLNQFRGIALAQEEANRRALNNRAQVPLRVILANSGDRFAQGVEVAEQIVDLAEDDDTIVGVVGITQSRQESRDAIGVLGDAGLPVVAGPVTGDQMLDEARSDRIYQVTARNDRIADLLVDFATSVPIVGPATAPAGSSELELMRDAVIVFDPDDEYSKNLSDDFERELIKTTDTTGRARVVADRVDYRADDEGGSASLTQVAIDTCDALADEHDIVFFASRAQQLPGFLDGLAETACADRGVTLVGGPDLTKFVQDPRVPLAHNYDFLRFYYSAHLFDTPELRRQVAFSSETLRFLTAYRADYPPESPTFDVADPANAYDALWAMKEAIDLAAEETSGPDQVLTGDLVNEALASGDVAFEGVSGYIAFDRIGKHIPADKPVLVVNLPLPFNGRNRRVEMLCGRLTSDPEPTAWGLGPAPCTPDD